MGRTFRDMHDLLATYSNDSAAAGAAGLGGLLVFLWILYGILCFFVPIFVWLIDKRVKEIRDLLRARPLYVPVLNDVEL